MESGRDPGGARASGKSVSPAFDSALVAADVVGIGSGVDDVANGLRRDPLDRGQDGRALAADPASTTTTPSSPTWTPMLPPAPAIMKKLGRTSSTSRPSDDAAREACAASAIGATEVPPSTTKSAVQIATAMAKRTTDSISSSERHGVWPGSVAYGRHSTDTGVSPGFMSRAVVPIGEPCAVSFWRSRAAVLALVAASALVWPPVLWSLVVVVPLMLRGVADMMQTRQAVRRNFPLIGHVRYLLEQIRPEINQYFVEIKHDGRPFSRNDRSVVYQRAKGELDTLPFGTQRDVYAVGYEWINHSLAPVHPDHGVQPRRSSAAPHARSRTRRRSSTCRR